MTRRTKQFVWLRWDAYGCERRGLSIKVTTTDFKRDYLPTSKRDGLDSNLWFRRSKTLCEILK